MLSTKRRAAKEGKPEEEGAVQNLRYGPLPTFPKQRQFVRIIIVLALFTIVYFYGNKPKEKIFASKTASYPTRSSFQSCSQSFQVETSKFPGCAPRRCGRGVYDKVVAPEEVKILKRIAELGLSLGNAAGSAAILDLHSGAVSHGDKFINIYKVANVWGKLIKPEDFATYKTVRTKIQHTIASQFKVDPASIFLTHPTFFSNLTAQPPKTIHDEYWHTHVDKETYGSFHYTALLYLSTYNEDFEGGRFLFVESDNSTTVIEPLSGRISVFTSGAENPHKVERVTKGFRLALTIAFTCDKRLSIADPTIK